jgi:hypothetical protein
MTLTARTRQASIAGATLAVAALLTAGCGSLGSSSAGAGSAGTGTATGTAASGSSATGTPAASGGATSTAAAGTGSASSGASGSGSSGSSGSSGTSGSSGSAGSSGTVASSSAPACSTSDLHITTGNYGGGAAGTFWSVVDFTNVSKASCTLYGYPGVSLRDASGGQIGAAGIRDASVAAKVITLAPGATANTSVGQTDPGVYPTAKCESETSTYLRVYPPNQTVYYDLSFKSPTCANTSINMLKDTAVALGSS